jgi:uncharacterized protein HemY
VDRLDKIKQLEQLTRDDPSDALAFYMLGTELLRADRSEAAAEALRHALHLDPRRAPVARMLGDALRRLGQNAEAREVYQRAIDLAEASGDLQVAREARALLAKLGSD